MRSRWRGSMFAWILNTKPVNGGSAGSTMRVPPSRGCGGGAHSVSADRISCTPKLLMPEPKNTGDCRPARNSARSNGALALRSSSTSWRSAVDLVRKQRVERGLSMPSMSSVSSLRRSSPGVKRSRRSWRRSNTPRNALPMPIGQVIGAQSMASTDSISSTQRQRLAHLAVHLVDEGDDRRGAQAAHFEQLDRLLLHALGGVDHHHRGVDRGEHAIGVLGKVLVARRVEQVDRVPGVLELHHRARDRDAALLLDLHPVGRRVARALARLDGAGQLDRAAVQQQLLGQRRLAGVRVRDDRERAPARDVAREVGREGAWRSSMKKSRRPGRRAAHLLVGANYTLPRTMTDRVPTFHPAPSAPKLALPKGACDAHVHVFGPAHVFPLRSGRALHARGRAQGNLFALHRKLGIERCVLVQSLAHGFDNRVMADAIAAKNGDYCGIALAPATADHATLRALDAQGFRGVRFNFPEARGQRDVDGRRDRDDAAPRRPRLAPAGALRSRPDRRARPASRPGPRCRS